MNIAVGDYTTLLLAGLFFRLGRSLVAIALVAAAAFVIVAVGAFRRDGETDVRKPDSESGGYTLLALSSQPLHHDPRTPEGGTALGIPADALDGVTLARFRRSAGEGASCLNLYRPSRPTVLGAEDSFLLHSPSRIPSSPPPRSARTPGCSWNANRRTERSRSWPTARRWNTSSPSAWATR